jgi:Fe2+ transport system protein B
MQTRGLIGHYLFTSAKTKQGIDELKEAIFDCEIDNGNKLIEPSEKLDPVKKLSK